VVLVDDEFAPLVPKIRAAVTQLSPKPIRFVINTHWHGDHTGGNAPMGEAGAVIVAHDNVRKRMSTEQFNAFRKRTTPPSPAMALPIVTFAQGVTFHVNGDDLEVIHVASAHTDGDAVILFRKANVLHIGDVFFNGFYPFIDSGSGGSIDGVVAAIDVLLPRLDDQTKVIPGHGPLGTKVDLEKYRDMLATIRDRIKKGIQEGKSQDQVVASKPSAEFDKVWGGGFLKPDTFVALTYDSLKTATKP
jgi:glyoxylase-like metal-dependent hydrolase (beta-lactamase superfamily II)